MIDIKLNASVQCSDGPCGKATNVVVNRVTRKVTNIVVEDKNFPEYSTRLVPISKVKKTVQERITLSCTVQDVTLMPPFMTTQFVQESASGKAASEGSSYYNPYIYGPGAYERYSMVVNDTGFDTVSEKNISADELSLACDMEIKASDGKIGKLDELIMDSENGDVTHILMKEGHLWGKKEMVIPLSAISSAKGGFILLKLDKKSVENLPTVPLKHEIKTGDI